ncbi:MAG: DUF5132 domain-containing protein [Desulfomonile tiedjei]|uniref:DUF5132 domain-containing protein n=1 Tax=Desulfomonile tiedjei TaxID=2358 RepID=A0A9D6Z234_9BACT|nr:DUF5132 domain-containing protein [Desulfomonile tiedjei]
MAILDYMPKIDVWTGAAIGVGLLVAPVLIPMIATAARPVLKTVIKGGFMAYEKSREMVAEAVEMVEDLAAEARSEALAEMSAEKGETA